MPTGIQVGHGVRTVATQRVFSQGMYQQTDNPLDVVIEGDGFFQVLLPDGGIRYTRDGALSLMPRDALQLPMVSYLPRDSCSP